jgi:hypothetical protein
LVTTKQIQTSTGRQKTRALCAIAVIAVLGATLWPFNPHVRNGVSWVPTGHGLKFDQAGLVLSASPLSLPIEDDSGAYSFELWIRPASVQSSSTILAIYDPSHPKQFQVKQWTDGLLVTHDAAVEHDRTGTIKFDVDHAFSPGKLVLVTLTAGSKGTTAYLNGTLTGVFPRFTISRNDVSGQIVLGTSPTSYLPWSGEFCGLAIYSRELSPDEVLQHDRQWANSNSALDLDGALALYRFVAGNGREVRNEVPSGPNLMIPAFFSLPHKPLLESAIKEFRPDKGYAVDVLVNILGFVPLGLIVCTLLVWTKSRWQSIFIATVACGLLSVVIEILQYYVPRRNSDITDIITNTLGGALGAVLIQAAPVREILRRMNLLLRTSR